MPRSQLVTRVIKVCYKIQPCIIIKKEHGILYQFESKGCDKKFCDKCLKYSLVSSILVSFRSEFTSRLLVFCILYGFSITHRGDQIAKGSSRPKRLNTLHYVWLWLELLQTSLEVSLFSLILLFVPLVRSKHGILKDTTQMQQILFAKFYCSFRQLNVIRLSLFAVALISYSGHIYLLTSRHTLSWAMVYICWIGISVSWILIWWCT